VEGEGEMTLSDLKTKGAKEYKSHCVSDKVDAAGRHHREYDGEEYYHIANGDMMEIHAWAKAFRQALIDAGQGELFEAVLNHISGLAFLRTDQDRELWAAECIDSGAHLSEQWKEQGFCVGEKNHD
jgi:hypothetical protein